MSATIAEGYIPGCIGRIVHLHASYYAASSGFGVEFEAKVARELANFCQAYEPGRDGIWLARQNEIEGSIIIDGSRVNEEGAHLRWFILSDTLRGQGIGGKLLASALQFVDSRRYKSTYLWTFAGLDSAKHLYESHGFHLVLERPGSQWGKVVREQQYVRMSDRADP